MSTKRRAAPTGATTAPTADETTLSGPTEAVPGLVLVHGPRREKHDDRAALCESLVVGRSSSCAWALDDEKLSRQHFRVLRREGRLVVEDLGSRNGTRADGREVRDRAPLSGGSVIRAGRSVFVVVDDLGRLAPPGAPPPPEMAGRYYAPIVAERLALAVGTGRPVLLSGESGTGKELAAEAIHRMHTERGRSGPFVARNAACYGGEDDAVAGLFGVAERTFTGVGARSSALVQAEGGTCYLDEIHNLPLRVQRSLLRFVEDGLLSPLGGEAPRRLDVMLVLGTNQHVDDAVDRGSLAGDLVARLHRVVLPPLRDRRADVPDIVAAVAERLLSEATAHALIEALDAPLVEELCLHDFRQGNVRELEDLTATAGACVREGKAPREALALAAERGLAASARAEGADAASPALSRYDRHRAEIEQVYLEVDGNLTRLEEALKARGIRCSRRWLAVYLDRWGLRPAPRRPGS